MDIEVEGKTKRDSYLWERHPEDYYVEPQWVSKRLFEIESFEGLIYDPACGMGRILRSAKMSGLDCNGSDIVLRGKVGFWGVCDFLDDAWRLGRVDNIVCNPPFKHAVMFVEKALERSRFKVAMLLPAKWICGDERSRWLETTPLSRVLFITPRPSMPPGPVIEAGIDPGGGREDFAWFVWDRELSSRTLLGWCRRDDDPEFRGDDIQAAAREYNVRLEPERREAKRWPRLYK